MSVATPPKILFSEDLRDEYRLSRPSVYRYMRTEGFPLPIRLGPNPKKDKAPKGRVAWIRKEVEQWIAERPRVEVV